MISIAGRHATSDQCLRARGLRRLFYFISIFLLGSVLLPAARAVIVRGRVTDVLGKAVPGARVQLIENGKVEAIAYAEQDGSYEIRSTQAGRFTLLGSSGGFLPAIGDEFYGGVTDVLERNVVLSSSSVKQEVSVTATGIPTPLQQLTAPVTVIPSPIAPSISPGLMYDVLSSSVLSSSLMGCVLRIPSVMRASSGKHRLGIEP